MPCSECGHLLFLDHDNEKLLCPNCLDIEIADRDIVEEKLERDRHLLRDKNLVQLLQDYDKGHLLLYLMERLNKVSHDLYESRRLKMREFAYINYLIDIVYPADESAFGDKYLERSDELDEEIDTLLSTQAELVRGLKHVEDRFRLCLEFQVPMEDGKFLFGDYDLRDTEYRYCFQRCLRSLIGGREEDLDLFDKTHEEIRDFEKPSSDEIDTLEDFGDTFYELILSMLFVASADNTVGDIYSTLMPTTYRYSTSQTFSIGSTDSSSTKRARSCCRTAHSRGRTKTGSLRLGRTLSATTGKWSESTSWSARTISMPTPSCSRSWSRRSITSNRDVLRKRGNVPGSSIRDGTPSYSDSRSSHSSRTATKTAATRS